MTPHKQLFRHKPDQGIYGDCYRTAIACLLDLPPSDVPHVYDGRDDAIGKARMESWLSSHGKILIDVAYADSVQTVLSLHEHRYPSLHWILSGISANGCNHVVICRGGQIVHDPAQDDSGIVGPCDDGHVWTTFLGALV